MMRKLLLFALMTVILGLLPFAAMGEITVETISEGSGKLATNRYAFQQEIPQVVKTQLVLHGYEDVHCVSGLALERLVLEAGTEVQVLSQTEDEWVHVVVPTARSTRCMDMNGTYGYVRLDELKLP